MVLWLKNFFLLCLFLSLVKKKMSNNTPNNLKIYTRLGKINVQIKPVNFDNFLAN